VDGSQIATGNEILLKSDFINLPRIFHIGTEKFSGSNHGSYGRESCLVKYLEDLTPSGKFFSNDL